jgi:DNA-binding response OmpR family regulator
VAKVTLSRKILIIDDDKTWQMFLSAALRDDYAVVTALDGDIGLELASEWQPDTILLDIEMPIKDGYEVCRALKSNPHLQHIPVIFVSSKSSLQERITGFKLGADDYLVKPCDAELLKIKVARSTALYQEKKALDEKATGAQVLAFEAMNSNADLGRSLRFAERTYVMQSLDQLAEGLFQTMAEFGLDTSLMFVTRAGPQFYAQNKHELSPLEKDMFLTIHREGRFCDFGFRTFCNFKLVSLLIKNMPESAPERYGRIKDTVPWILGVTDGKVSALDTQATLLAQHEYVSESILRLRTLLSHSLQELNTPADNAKPGSNLVAALALLDGLAEAQDRTSKLVKADAENNQAIELSSGEIFSSDVDFF